MESGSTKTKQFQMLAAALAIVFAGALALFGAQGAWAAADDAAADGAGIAAGSAQLDELATQAPSKGSVPNGDYLIATKLKSRVVLDVKAASEKAGANVQLGTWDFTDSVKWRFLYHKSGGYYTIANVNSGMVLGVKKASTKNRANVIQQKPTGEKHQRWFIKNTKAGYRIQSALKANFVLDVDNAKTAYGTNVRMYEANGSTAQRFALIPVDRTAKPSTVTVADGAYIIKNSKSGKTVAVKGASMSDDANICQNGTGGSYAQRFYFESDGEGYYRIINIATGFSMQVREADIYPESNVVQSTCDAGNEQLWAIWQQSDGSVRIVPKNEGLHGTLEVANGSTKNGANIRVNTWAKANNQTFTLTSVPLLSEGVVSLRSAKATNKALKVYKSSLKKGAKLVTYDYDATAAQKFSVTHDSKGRCILRSVCSGYYVTHDDGNIVQGKKQSAWTVSFADSGIRRGIKLTNNAKSKALSMPSTTNNGRAELLYVTSSAAQRFLPQAEQLVTDGYYNITSGLGTRRLDIDDNSSKNGTNVQIYKKSNGGSQLFKIAHVGGGYYRISQPKSGKCIEVVDGSTADHANVQLYAKKSRDSQLWMPTLSKKGYLTFTNKASGKLLSVRGNKNEDEANVVSVKNKNKAGQLWRLKATTASSQAARTRAAAKVANKTSTTGYLVAVDLKEHYTVVFKGSSGAWEPVKTYLCTTGKSLLARDLMAGARNYSKTVGKSTYYYATSFGTNGTFCSVPYKKNTKTLRNATLGKSTTGTSVRLPMKQAKWIYDHIPNGTKVVLYK